MKTRSIVCLTALCVLSLAMSAQGLDYTGTGDWTNAANWGGTEPTTADATVFNDGAVATVTQTGEECSSIDVRNGTLNITSGDLTTSHRLYTGYPASAVSTLTINGGTLQVGDSASDHLYIGYSADSVSTVTLSSGTLSTDADVYLGAYDGTTTMTQSGGIFTANGNYGLYIGGNATATATLILTGGTVDAGYAGSARGITIGGWEETTGAAGTLSVVGDDAIITAEAYVQYSSGTLKSTIDGDGISVIGVNETAALDGTFTVLDSGAANGTYTILSADDLGGAFDTVNLPNANWSYNIDTVNDVLTVTVIPEPATLGLFGIAGASMLWIRRRSSI